MFSGLKELPFENLVSVFLAETILLLVYFELLALSDRVQFILV